MVGDEGGEGDGFDGEDGVGGDVVAEAGDEVGGVERVVVFSIGLSEFTNGV